MKCGIYELDITPWLGLDIPGQFSKRVSIDILERLSAIASYFESVGEKVVIISTDSIIVPDEAVSVIKNNIAKKLDMKTSNVFICATHTHTGGPVENWGEFFKAKGEYIELYTARCIDAAVLAAKDAREVKLSFGIGKENTIANYRVRVLPDGSIQTNAPSGSGTKPYGEIDPDVSVLRIDNADGTLYGAIVNYACHCDCVCGSAPEASL
ncbi:MAG: hypothetical protein GX633_06395, partial [Clostridiales bacterium]|nr:hypothetical protein [Clostridiales bacterium]